MPKSTLLDISKALFLEAMVCPTKGWYIRHQSSPAPISDTDLFLMEQRQQVGELARSLDPEGSLIMGSSEEKNKAEKDTQEQITAKSSVLFEATFRPKPFVAKADILTRMRGGWKITEVQAKVYPTTQKEKKPKLPKLLDDLTYTVMVATQTGIRIPKASLLLLSKDFRTGMDPSLLFVEEDCTKEVKKRLPRFRKEAKTLPNMTASKTRPKPTLITACNTCEFFSTKCLGKGILYPVTDIPRLGKKIEKVSSVKVTKLPTDFPLTHIQKTVVHSIKTRKPYIARDKMRMTLDAIVWPVYYLDFETTNMAIPFYPNTKPYEQIATQYSLHRRQNPRAKITHCKFLAQNPEEDPRPDLAKQLRKDLSTKGSILVYSNFEKGIINDLATQFPLWEKDLKNLIARLVDLKELFTTNGKARYYHPDFHGSFSLKKVLPVLVPGQDYSALAVQDGLAASASFAKMAMGLYSRREADRARNDLLEYCKQDTLAMVALHKALEKMQNVN